MRQVDVNDGTVLVSRVVLSPCASDTLDCTRGTTKSKEQYTTALTQLAAIAASRQHAKELHAQQRQAAEVHVECIWTTTVTTFLSKISAPCARGSLHYRGCLPVRSLAVHT